MVVFDQINHDKMYSKGRVLEGGYLGKHNDPTMTYTSQVMIGSQTNTRITKRIFEYGETIGDASGIFKIGVKRIMCESHRKPNTENEGLMESLDT